jgi:hypothetical protein
MIEKIYEKAGKVLKKNLPLGRCDETFFQKYPHFVNIRFFLANYENLTSDNCITRYVHYMRELNNAGFEKNYSYILESFGFIQQYCKTHNITIEEYETYKEPNKNLESFWIHLKDRNISSYALIFFPKCVQKVLTSDREDTKYYLEDISELTQKISEVDSNQKLKTKLTKLKTKLLL